jgi:anti-sigma B factor antagonist
MAFEVRSTRDKDACVVCVVGEVDLYSSPSLKSTLMAMAEGDTSLVIVDLGAATFIDSAGIGVPVGALRRAKESGDELRVVCNQNNIAKILRLTGLDRVLPIFDTVEHALQTEADVVGAPDRRPPRRRLSDESLDGLRRT